MKKRTRHILAGILFALLLLAPFYTRMMQRTRETLLRQNLFTLRAVIDEYTQEKKAAPKRLEDLVKEGYLRDVPVDPLTGSNTTWILTRTQTGVSDVHSGAKQYTQW